MNVNSAVSDQGNEHRVFSICTQESQICNIPPAQHNQPQHDDISSSKDSPPGTKSSKKRPESRPHMQIVDPYRVRAPTTCHNRPPLSPAHNAGDVAAGRISRSRGHSPQVKRAENKARPTGRTAPCRAPQGSARPPTPASALRKASGARGRRGPWVKRKARAKASSRGEGQLNLRSIRGEGMSQVMSKRRPCTPTSRLLNG